MEIIDYLEEKKNGMSNYDIFAEVASEQGCYEYFTMLNHDSLENLVDIFSMDSIVEKYDGNEFLKVARLYLNYIELKQSLYNAQNKELQATLNEQIKIALEDLKKYGLPLSISKIRKEITKRAVEIPTGDDYMDNVRKIMFEVENDYDETNGDFYLIQARQAQRKGVEDYLSNISSATLYSACGVKIEELYKEQKYDRDILDKLRKAKTACVCFYASCEDDTKPTKRILEAIRLLKAFNCLVTEEEFVSEVENAIAKLNGDTVKSPITLN